MKQFLLLLLSIGCYYCNPLFGKKLDLMKFQKALWDGQTFETKDYLAAELVPKEEMEKFGLNPNASMKGVEGPFHMIYKKGMLPGTEFELYSCNLLNIRNPLCCRTGYINEKGIAILKEKKGEISLENMYAMLGSPMPGEPIFMTIVSKDRATYLSTCIIGVPLETFGAAKRHVSMCMLSRYNTAFLVQGDNFEPGEIVLLTTEVGKDKAEGVQLTVSDKGTFVYVFELKNKKFRKNFLQIWTNKTEPITLSYDVGIPKKSARKET